MFGRGSSICCVVSVCGIPFVDWALSRENRTSLHANNKGADQPGCAVWPAPFFCVFKSLRILLHAKFRIIEGAGVVNTHMQYYKNVVVLLLTCGRIFRKAGCTVPLPPIKKINAGFREVVTCTCRMTFHILTRHLF